MVVAVSRERQEALRVTRCERSQIRDVLSKNRARKWGKWQESRAAEKEWQRVRWRREKMQIVLLAVSQEVHLRLVLL